MEEEETLEKRARFVFIKLVENGGKSAEDENGRLRRKGSTER